ncbi:hypothetical protein L1887_48576 [Cichorium endivia]|nr:hypothetical protein L1887_48576 [Cichorium endivia]
MGRLRPIGSKAARVDVFREMMKVVVASQRWQEDDRAKSIGRRCGGGRIFQPKAAEWLSRRGEARRGEARRGEVDLTDRYPPFQQGADAKMLRRCCCCCCCSAARDSTEPKFGSRTGPVQLRVVVRLAAHAAWVRSSPPTAPKDSQHAAHNVPHACTLQIEIRRGHPSKITETAKLCRSTPTQGGAIRTSASAVVRASAVNFFGEEFALAARFAPHGCPTERRRPPPGLALFGWIRSSDPLSTGQGRLVTRKHRAAAEGHTDMTGGERLCCLISAWPRLSMGRQHQAEPS